MSGRKATPDIMGDLLNGKAPAKPAAQSFDLRVPDDFTRDEWESFGARIATADARIRFVIGDWIIAGSNKWGDMYADAQRITGKSKQYLTDCVWVARAFELSSREDNLSWSHHRALVAADEDQRQALTDQVKADGLSVAKTRELINRPEPDAAPRVNRGKCKICNRPLTAGQSVIDGMGPCCAAKAARAAGAVQVDDGATVTITMEMSRERWEWLCDEVFARGGFADWVDEDFAAIENAFGMAQVKERAQ